MSRTKTTRYNVAEHLRTPTDGILAVTDSKTFYGNQFPAPILVQNAVKAVFR